MFGFFYYTHVISPERAEIWIPFGFYRFLPSAKRQKKSKTTCHFARQGRKPSPIRCHQISAFGEMTKNDRNDKKYQNDKRVTCKYIFVKSGNIH